jgi:hypothetical protein
MTMLLRLVPLLSMSASLSSAAAVEQLLAMMTQSGCRLLARTIGHSDLVAVFRPHLRGHFASIRSSKLICYSFAWQVHCFLPSNGQRGHFGLPAGSLKRHQN